MGFEGEGGGERRGCGELMRRVGTRSARPHAHRVIVARITDEYPVLIRDRALLRRPLDAGHLVRHGA